MMTMLILDDNTLASLATETGESHNSSSLLTAQLVYFNTMCVQQCDGSGAVTEAGG